DGGRRLFHRFGIADRPLFAVDQRRLAQLGSGARCLFSSQLVGSLLRGEFDPGRAGVGGGIGSGPRSRLGRRVTNRGVTTDQDRKGVEQYDGQQQADNDGQQIG